MGEQMNGTETSQRIISLEETVKALTEVVQELEMRVVELEDELNECRKLYFSKGKAVVHRKNR